MNHIDIKRWCGHVEVSMQLSSVEVGEWPCLHVVFELYRQKTSLSQGSNIGVELVVLDLRFSNFNRLVLDNRLCEVWRASVVILIVPADNMNCPGVVVCHRYLPIIIGQCHVE